MTDPRQRRGWTSYVEETPVRTILEMPQALSETVNKFITDLADVAGAAIDAGEEPPGDRMDRRGYRYSLSVGDEPVLIEYTVHHGERQFRVPALVWFN